MQDEPNYIGEIVHCPILTSTSGHSVDSITQNNRLTLTDFMCQCRLVQVLIYLIASLSLSHSCFLTYPPTLTERHSLPPMFSIVLILAALGFLVTPTFALAHPLGGIQLVRRTQFSKDSYRVPELEIVVEGNSQPRADVVSFDYNLMRRGFPGAEGNRTLQYKLWCD